MASAPLISVVIPTYNRCQATQAAVESVLAQTWRPLQVIVVDDGSNDGSADELKAICDHLSSPGVEVTLIRQNNQGPSLARNAGLKCALGRWVAFLDSDDSWLPEKLERQMRVLEQFAECGGCFTDARYLNSAGMDESTFRLFGRHYGQPSGIDWDAPGLLARSFCGFFLSTLLVSTEIVRRIGGLDAEVGFAEDRDLYFRLALVTPLAYLDEPLVRTDRSPSPAGSTCRPWDKVEVRLQGHQRMYEKWLGLGTALPREIRRIVKRELQSTHCHWANFHLENRQYGRARHAVSRAIRYKISPKMSVKWALTWTAPALAARISGKSSSYL